MNATGDLTPKEELKALLGPDGLIKKGATKAQRDRFARLVLDGAGSGGKKLQVLTPLLGTFDDISGDLDVLFSDRVAYETLVRSILANGRLVSAIVMAYLEEHNYYLLPKKEGDAWLKRWRKTHV